MPCHNLGPFVGIGSPRTGESQFDGPGQWGLWSNRASLHPSKSGAYPERSMSATEFDRVMENLLRLSPAERAQVKERLEQLDPAPSKGGGLRALAGVISAEDAELMRQAIEDCERIDPRGW